MLQPCVWLQNMKPYNKGALFPVSCIDNPCMGSVCSLEYEMNCRDPVTALKEDPICCHIMRMNDQIQDQDKASRGAPRAAGPPVPPVPPALPMAPPGPPALREIAA